MEITVGLKLVVWSEEEFVLVVLSLQAVKESNEVPRKPKPKEDFVRKERREKNDFLFIAMLNLRAFFGKTIAK